jgi:hypothetical protein
MSKLTGRPTSCTVQVIEKFSAARREGNPLADCGILAGLGASTHISWMDRGEEGEEPYIHFYYAVKKAEAEFKQERINLIKKSHDVDPKNWAASMTLLERMFPHDFRKDNTRIYLKKIEGTDSFERLESVSIKTLEQITNGEIPVEIGTLVLKAIDDRRRLLETLGMEKRMSEIEKKLDKNHSSSI